MDNHTLVSRFTVKNYHLFESFQFFKRQEKKKKKEGGLIQIEPFLYTNARFIVQNLVKGK